MPSFPQTRAFLWQIRILWQLDPKLYVPAILGLWVYKLFGTAHITLAVEWKITFISKFGVPSSPQSRASLLWNEKSRLLPSLGCPCSHNRGCNCGRLCYLVHIAHIPAFMWNQNRVYGLVWDTLLRDWKPLWETSTCVGRLICPEGHVAVKEMQSTPHENTKSKGHEWYSTPPPPPFNL